MKTLNRSKLNYKLRKLHQYPITFASAPSGFGKSTSLHLYLNNQDIDCVWFSMYDQKDELWAWSELIDILSQHYKNIELSHMFPNTRSSISSFIDVLSTYLNKPLFVILDDVTIYDIPNIMKALSTYSHISIPLLHFIVITKDTMDMVTSYHFSNDTLLLNSNDFAFSLEETIHLCRLEGIKLSKEEIKTLHEYTHGWIIALSLMFESYKTYHNLHYQGDVNILIRRVLFDSLDIKIQEDLMKLSILKHFTLPFASKICKTKESIQKLIQLEKENHFIQTVDHQTYQFIPMFKEFLMKRLLVSSIEIDRHTKDIGYLYLAHDKPLEAIETFLSIYDYKSIMHVFNQYPETGFSDIAPRLMINVFKKLPNRYKNEYPYIYLKWIIDCVTNFPQLNGLSLLDDFKERVDNNLIQQDTQQLYGEYYFIHAFIHFNNVIEMMDDFKTAYKYFNGNHSRFAYPFMITSFGSCHMLFLYYNKIGYLKETVNYIEKNIHYFIEITDGIHSGSSALVKAEYLYETGQYNDVSLYTTLAYKEAIDNNQLSGAICCLFLMGRMKLMDYNMAEFKQIKQQLIDFYDKTNIPILHNEIDCALGYLYILNNEYDSIQPWLRTGSFDDAYLLPEASMMAYIIHGVCLIKEHNLVKLQQICELIRETNHVVYFALADIYAGIFETVYYYKIGKTQTALEQLIKVIELCSHDMIVSPIIELSFAFEQLFEKYTPNSYFEEKIITQVNKHLKRNASKLFSSKILTNKEIEVLKLCSQGKKVKDIAIEKHVSINTIQTHMKSIYKKLGITSKLEAIQYYNNNFK